MNADGWERLSSWHNAWLAGDATERERLRAQLALDHPDLVADADALTASSSSLGEFLETPAFVLAARTLVEDEPLLPPEAMVGPYRIVGLLARGGMGDVYRATDVRLRRDVALKILPSNKSRDWQRLDRFVQEGRVTASIDHPNVVRVYDVGLYEQRPFLVAELLDGETLRARIARGGIPSSEARRIALEVAQGLVAAHAAGLVHRDLKPENIFLSRLGTTKILDFGLAKLAQDDRPQDGLSTITGVVLGTAGYLAPEQIRGEGVDGRADLFALGAVLFEMLSGRRAFARAHVVDTLHAILHEPPATLEGNDLPPALVTIVERLLEKAPSDRFQTAADVISALEGSMEPHPAVAEAGSGSTRAALAPEAPSRVHATTASARWSLNPKWLVPALACLMAAVAATFWYRQQTPASGSAPTLAVFPFRSLPAGPDTDLFELGLTDVIISRLGQLQDVRILPLSATERLRSEDPKEAAGRLGATEILTGTVQRDAGSLRVSVQLRSMPDERVIWTDTFDAEASSIFSVQDGVVRRLLEAMAPRLSLDARSRLTRPGTANNDAFEAYLRGRAYGGRPNEADLRRAIDLYQGAVALDPSFADAWAGLAGAYRLLPIGADLPPADTFPEARKAAERALQLDPSNAEAHEVLGTVAFWYEWDYPKAERLLSRAVMLQPSSVSGHRFLAHLLSNIGRHDEALVAIRRAQQLDPTSLPAQALEGQFLFMARHYDESLAQLNHTIGLDSRFVNAHMMRLYPLIALKHYDEAIRGSDTIERLLSANPNVPHFWPLTLRAFTLGRMGRTAEAEAALASLRQSARERYVPRFDQALVLHALGREDEALEQLRLAVDNRDWFVTFIGVDSKWDELRQVPAFRAQAARVNLLDVSDRAVRAW